MLQKTKSLLTKCLAFLFIVCCVVAATVGMVACSDDQAAAKTIESITNDGKNIVITYGDKTQDVIKYTDATTPSDPVTPVEPDEECKHEHTKDVKLDVESEKKCTATYKVFCEDCGDLVDVKIVTEHDYDETVKVTVKRKSCLDRAFKAYKCRNCESYKSDSIEYLPANEENWNLDGAEHVKHEGLVEDKEYLIDEDGKMVDISDSSVSVCIYAHVTATVCAKCHVEITSTVEEAAGHKYETNAWEVKEAPGVNQKKGQIERVCTVCNAIDTKEILPLYETVVNAEDQEVDGVNVNGKYSLKANSSSGDSCSSTGRTDTYTFKVNDKGEMLDIKADGQTLEFTITVKESHYFYQKNAKVSVEDGKVYICDDDDLNAKLFFIVGADVVIKCGSTGYEAAYQCAECKEHYTLMVRKEHPGYKDGDEKIGETIEAATCLKDAKFDYKCSGCGEIVSATSGEVDKATGHSYICDKTEGTNGFATVKGKNYVYITCKNEGCTSTFEAVELEEGHYKTKPQPATCTDPAATVYYDIEFKENDEYKPLIDTKGDSIKISVVADGAEPNGHHYGIVKGEKYDIADLESKGVDVDKEVIIIDNTGDKEFNCTNFDGSTDGKWRPAGFYCDDCEGYVGFYIKKSHTPKDDNSSTESWITMNDCESAGKKKIICDICGEVEIDIPEEGHDLQYTVNVANDGKVTISGVKCVREGCSYTDLKGAFATDGTVEVTDYKAPTCKDFGEGVVKGTGDEEDTTIVIAKLKNEHLLGNVVINGTKDHPAKFISGMKSFKGQEVKCYIPSDVDKDGNVFFQCTECNGYYNTFAVIDHDLVTETITAATCTIGGTQKEECKNTGCNYESDSVNVPALGHKITTYTCTVSDDKGVVTVTPTCGNTGCSAELSISISVGGWYDLANGEVTIANDTVTAAKFSCNVIGGNAATCKTAATYRFTLVTDADGKYTYEVNDARFIFANGLSFDITLKANHKTSTDANDIVEWESNDGNKYKAVLCPGCDHWVPVAEDAE